MYVFKEGWSSGKIKTVCWTIDHHVMSILTKCVIFTELSRNDVIILCIGGGALIFLVLKHMEGNKVIN